MSKLIRRGAALVSGTHIYIGETASEGAIARVRREQISGQFIVTGCHQLRFGLRLSENVFTVNPPHAG